MQTKHTTVNHSNANQVGQIVDDWFADHSNDVIPNTVNASITQSYVSHHSLDMHGYR